MIDSLCQASLWHTSSHSVAHEFYKDVYMTCVHLEDAIFRELAHLLYISKAFTDKC